MEVLGGLAKPPQHPGLEALVAAQLLQPRIEWTLFPPYRPVVLRVHLAECSPVLSGD